MKVKVLERGVIMIGPVVAGWSHTSQPNSYQGTPTGYDFETILSQDQRDSIASALEEPLEKAKDYFANRKDTKPAQIKKVKKLTTDDIFREVEDDDGEPSGEFRLKAKSPIKNGPVPVYDAGLNRVNTSVMKGDVVNFRFRIGAYSAGIGTGISNRLLSVQIIEKGAGQSDDPTGGFEEQDGWEGSEAVNSSGDEPYAQEEDSEHAF